MRNEEGHLVVPIKKIYNSSFKQHNFGLSRLFFCKAGVMLQLSVMGLLDEFSNEASRVMPYLNAEGNMRKLYVCCEDLLGGHTFPVYLAVSLANPGVPKKTWERFPWGTFFGQLLRRTLGGLAPIGSEKAVTGGTIKISATGWSKLPRAVFY